MQAPIVATGVPLDHIPPPPCTPGVYVDGGTGGGSNPPSSPPPSSDGGAGDALHAERMEYIRQLVQERDNLANAEGCEVARRLIEQGKLGSWWGMGRG